MPKNPMAVVHAARRDNLRLLAHRLDGQHILAERLGWSSSFMSQMIGKNPSKEISERTARKIETKLSLQAGWLDIARGAQ